MIYWAYYDARTALPMILHVRVITLIDSINDSKHCIRRYYIFTICLAIRLEAPSIHPYRPVELANR